MATTNLKAVISAQDNASSTIAGVGGGFKQMAGAMALGQLAANAVSKAISLAIDKVKEMTSAAFNQVREVENATFALKAYEKNGGKVNRVLRDLIKFARSDPGVLFQREDLFAAASTLKLYGQTTESLTGKVKILARGVALGKTTFQELSQIIGRAAAKGRLDAVDFDMLIERGIGLDRSFRGAEVTSKELFKALEKALPAEILEGRANTIDGVMIRLNTAFRDLGSAILGVDKETTTFVKGGLGDRIIEGMKNLRNIMARPEITEGFKRVGEGVIFLAEKGWELGKSLYNLFRTVYNYVNPALQELRDALRNDLVPAIKNMWNSLSDSEKKALVDFAKLLGGVVIVNILAFVKGLTALVKAFTAIVNGATEARNKVEDFIGDTINNINNFQAVVTEKIDSAKAKFESFKEKVGAVIDVIKTKIEEAKNKVKSFFDFFKGEPDVVIERMNKLEEKLNKFTDDTVQGWKDSFEQMKQSASDKWEAIKTSLSEKWEAIKQSASDKWNSIKETIKNAWNNVKNAFTWEKIKERMRNAWQSIKDIANNAVETIKNTIKNLFTPSGKEKKDGEKLANNFVESAKKKAGSIESIRKIGDAVASLIGAVVLATVVYFVDAGIRLAKALIRGTINHVRNIGSSLKNTIVNSIHGMSNLLYDKGVQLINGLVNGVRSAAGRVASAVSSAVNNAISDVPLVGGIINKLKGNASGTDFFGGGMTMVGERGPELISLPRGSKVMPNDKVNKMGGGGNTTVNITVPMYTGSANERRKVAKQLIQDLQDLAQSNGKSVTDMLGSNYGLI